MANFYYNSTINTLSTLSTMYNAAVANNNYAIAVSTQSYLEKVYVDAITTYTQADIAWSNSIAQTGIAASSGPTNTFWQTRSMAKQALATAEKNAGAAQSSVAIMQSIAGVVNNTLYTTLLYKYEQDVVNNLYLSNTFMNYKLSSLESLKRWSSMYESANIDISTYKGRLNMYSTFYTSSMLGGSTLLLAAAIDYSTIAGKNAYGNILSNAVRIAEQDYSGYMSSYNSYMSLSTFYTEAVERDRERIRVTTGYYESTKSAISRMNTQNVSLMLSQITYDTSLFAQSSILNTAFITLATYDTQIKNNVNILENTAYQYRETYTRVKRIGVQNKYEDLVTQAVQNASTATQKTGKQQAADLTTLGIPATYSNLTSINTFLDSFSNIYTTYKNQTSNIVALSTSIGYQSNAWSSLRVYTSNAYYKVGNYSSLSLLVKTGNIEFSAKTDAMNAQLLNYSKMQANINSMKELFSTSYSTLFTPSEITLQESTISSFMIDGYKTAMGTLAASGKYIAL